MPDPIGYAVRGIEPKGDPDWAKVGTKGQKAFWEVVGKAGLKVKDRSLAKGLDKNGRPLRDISDPTRRARNADINPVSGRGPYSIMGRAFGAAPPLMATGDMSRTRQWLRYELLPNGVWFYWINNWGRVLARHAKGYVQVFRYPKRGIGHVPPRDVIGQPNSDVATIKRLAWEWWALHKREYLPKPERVNVVEYATPRGPVQATYEEAVRLGIQYMPGVPIGPRRDRLPKRPPSPPAGPQVIPFVPRPPMRPAAATQPLRPTGTSGQSPFFPHPPGRVPPSPHEMLAQQRREMTLAVQRPKPLPLPPPKKPATPLPPPKAKSPKTPLVTPQHPQVYSRPESITRAITIAEKMDIRLTPEGHASIVAQFGEHRAGGVHAVYDPATRTIVLNQKSSVWTDPSQLIADYRSGFKSTDNPDRIVQHEIGHGLHHAAIGDKRFEAMRGLTFGPAQADIAGQVSKYARTSYAEFVAETYAGLLDGKIYSPEVMGLYAKFGGPEIK